MNTENQNNERNDEAVNQKSFIRLRPGMFIGRIGKFVLIFKERINGNERSLE